MVAQPHPQYGGTQENKVVQALARAFVELGYAALRPNFRGVGASEGTYDEGRGEVDDLAAVLTQARRELGELPLHGVVGRDRGATVAGTGTGCGAGDEDRCKSSKFLLIVSPSRSDIEAHGDTRCHPLYAALVILPGTLNASLSRSPASNSTANAR